MGRALSMNAAAVLFMLRGGNGVNAMVDEVVRGEVKVRSEELDFCPIGEMFVRQHEASKLLIYSPTCYTLLSTWRPQEALCLHSCRESSIVYEGERVLLYTSARI